MDGKSNQLETWNLSRPVSVSVSLMSYSFTIAFVSERTFSQLQPCGAKPAHCWQQITGDEKNNVISVWDVNVLRFSGLVTAGIFLQILRLAFWSSEWNVSALVVRSSVWGDMNNKPRVKVQRVESEMTQVITGHPWSDDQWKYHKRGEKCRQPLSWSLSWSGGFYLEHQNSRQRGIADIKILRWEDNNV